jgi:hypothetical protein
LPFLQQRPQPCMHLALRTIPRFHPVQQTFRPVAELQRDCSCADDPQY